MLRDHRALYKRAKFETEKSGSIFSFDLRPELRIVLAVSFRHARLFDYLELARKSLKAIDAIKPKQVGLYLALEGLSTAILVDAFVSAHTAKRYRVPKFHKPEKPVVGGPLNILVDPKSRKECESRARRAELWTQSTNLVRTLTERPGNDLTPGEYLKTASKLAAAEDLSVQLFSLERLEKMGAGAFLAVARGAEDPDQAIVKVMYKPVGADAQPPVVLVGKGITFDTGGNNLKTGSSMFGMNADMAGSAVALALTILAKREQWPFPVIAYLAIAQNVLGARSFRPNDVVKTLSGKTIEIVDTDAEGRLVLADTLSLTAQDQPAFIIDFATLTGACVRAIGTKVSGVFSNRRKLLQLAEKAGRESGERLWPFPNDADYAECLESEVADIKQCRSSGGVDHIEASMFLRRFVPKNTPWVHVDLSAIENEGGLGHVDSKVTGFGVRAGALLIEKAHAWLSPQHGP